MIRTYTADITFSDDLGYDYEANVVYKIDHDFDGVNSIEEYTVKEMACLNADSDYAASMSDRSTTQARKAMIHELVMETLYHTDGELIADESDMEDDY